MAFVRGYRFNLIYLLAGVLLAGCWSSLPTAAVGQEVGELDPLMLIRVLATKEEARTLRKLKGAEDEAAYIAAFWARRDPRPDASGNLYREQMEQAAREVHGRFREGMRSGLETDRGRIFLLYGEPGQITQQLYHPRMKPHEVWQYDPADAEGGMMCVFWDEDGFGRLTLLHSTFPNEPFRPEWRRLVARK